METWKEIDGTDGKYEVSTLGRIRNKSTKHIRKTQSKHGYRRINLKIDGKDKNCSVHRLVATAFISNEENKPEVNHKDGDRTNNRVSNLEWVTQQENFDHAVKHRLVEKGIARAKRIGHGRGNDKPKLYLKKSELITKENYEKLIELSESCDITIGKLTGIFYRAINCGRYRIDFNKSELVPTDQYVNEIKEPYVRNINKLESENEALKSKLAETREFTRTHFVWTEREEWAIGNKNNHLTIIGYTKAKENNGKKLVCRCDCGRIVLENGVLWENGKVKSCGCMREDLLSESLSGDSEERKRKEDWLYSLWLRQHRKDSWYEQWRDYNAFYEWAYANGYEPGKHLHRLNTTRGFFPENCVWRGKQQYVKTERPKYSVNGEMLTVVEACERYGLLPATVRYRISRGMSLEEAINTKKCSNGRRTNTLKV